MACEVPATSARSSMMASASLPASAPSSPDSSFARPRATASGRTSGSAFAAFTASATRPWAFLASADTSTRSPASAARFGAGFWPFDASARASDFGFLCGSITLDLHHRLPVSPRVCGARDTGTAFSRSAPTRRPSLALEGTPGRVGPVPTPQSAVTRSTFSPPNCPGCADRRDARFASPRSADVCRSRGHSGRPARWPRPPSPRLPPRS